MATKSFETQTVPAKQTIVEDKLKPTAEMQILVGVRIGPVAKNIDTAIPRSD